MGLTNCDIQGSFRSSSLVFNVQWGLEYSVVTVGILMLKNPLNVAVFNMQNA